MKWLKFWKPQTENQRKADPCALAAIFGTCFGFLTGAINFSSEQDWRGPEWVVCAIMLTMMAFCLYYFIRHPDVRRWYNRDKAEKKARKTAKRNRHEVV